jgi:hypothetical protein
VFCGLPRAAEYEVPAPRDAWRIEERLDLRHSSTIRDWLGRTREEAYPTWR